MNGYVEVEGLGRDDTYRVTAEGDVEGDGPIKEHIEEALSDV
ncbi:MAG: hypothetical protein MAG715_00354 [Methanonatronarchaeales archaeon]|nr:hypothetical protein [Methanonatronarchaeales archaeon]